MFCVAMQAACEDIAIIKVVAPLMAQRVVDRAIQVRRGAACSHNVKNKMWYLLLQAHGAMGLSGDRPLAQFFSWARILRLADGPDEVHTAALGKMELRKTHNRR